jgi:hypothetical protein
METPVIASADFTTSVVGPNSGEWRKKKAAVAALNERQDCGFLFCLKR